MTSGAAPGGDMAGRTALVTGANSGLGLATACLLAQRGAEVVLACRDPSRGSDACRRVASVATGPAPSLVVVDLADLASVTAAAAVVARSWSGLDVLVANAGVMAIPPMLSADGFELQLATNHLGPFALTGRLLPMLLARPAPRVVTVGSLAAWQADVVVGDLQSERAYDPWVVYARTKRANLLTAFELDRRARAAGSSLRSLAAHPGWASTDLVANGPGRWTGAGGKVVYRVAGLAARSAHAGAGPQVAAATDTRWEGGTLVGPRWLLWGRPRAVRPPRGARSPSAGAALWEASEALTGVVGPLPAP